MSSDARQVPVREVAPGFALSAIGMGCSRLGAFWQGRWPATGLAAVAAARAAGINLFDTADCYARGISERVLGRALHADGDAIVICTKVGLLKTPIARAAARRAGASPRLDRCFASEYVRWACERSLRRLRTDRLDVLLLHSPSAQDLGRDEPWEALEALREDGSVGRYGVSCDDATAARAAVLLPGVSVLELPWSPQFRGAYEEVVDEARERGIVILANRVYEGIGPEGGAQSVKTALAAEGIGAVLIGMSRPEHVKANASVAGEYFAHAS